MNDTIRYTVEKKNASCEGESFGRKATVLFSPVLTGFLSVAGQTFPVKDGVCVLPVPALPDGKLETVLITKEGTLTCDALEKCGDKLCPAPLGDGDVRALRRRVSDLETAVGSLTEAVASLTRAVGQNQIF